MAAVLDFIVSLETTTCPGCGVAFAAPGSLLRSLRESKGSFYCPNGHSQSYTESRAQILERELSAAKRATEVANNEAAQARVRADNAEGREAAAVKKLARTKNGVCPCCNRSFTALQRHIKTKHPEFNPR